MLSVDRLTKIYTPRKGRAVRALDGVSLEFPEKGLVFLLGRSGSGKTTLLNILGGIDTPSYGEMSVDGRSFRDFSSSDLDAYRNSYVGFVFQGFYMEEGFSVLVNVEIPLILRGAEEKAREARAREMLAKFDLADKEDALPAQLSGGQMQRVCIARALAGGAQLILADEPTGNLDSKSGSAVMDVFRTLAQEGVTVVMVTHNKEFAARCDRVIELKDGRVQ